jgi:hypothetical protein
MSVRFDDLFQREYDYERYNCLHFTVEVWRRLFNIDLAFLVPAFVCAGGTHSLQMQAFAGARTFRRLPRPQSPCLCLMRGLAADETHIATWLDGRVLHLVEQGVGYFLPEVVFHQYKKVLFYEYCCDH